MAVVLQGRKVISFVGATTNPASITLNTLWAQGAGGTNYTPVQGDVVYVGYAIGGNLDIDVTMVTSGYTELTDLYANGTSYDANLAIFRKVMGSTPDTSVQVGPTTNAQFAGAVVVEVWSGVDTTTPEDVTPTTATGTGTGRPSPPPAITPTTTGAVVTVIGAGAAQTGANFAQSGSELTSFLSATGVDTVDITIGAGHFAWTSGTFSPVNWVAGSAIASNSWAAVSIALRPQSTNTNMTADPGSYSYTGTDATLARSLIMAAAAATYALTGTDATLTEGSGLTHYSMPAAFAISSSLGPELITDTGFDDAGQWTPQAGWAVTGGVAQATATTNLILTTYNLGEIGHDYAYSFTIANYVSGSVRARFGAATGVARSANGTFTGNIVATANSTAGMDGVTAFTGDITDISFREKVGYGVTGTDVTFSTGVAGYTMPADAGTYGLTGTAANLYDNKLVTADPGTYALTGTAATLARSRIMAAAPATYTLTGTAANLLRNRLVTAVPGTYALTGTVVNLRESAITMDAAPASYALTGTAATFPRTWVIGAVPGSYSLTGTDANLLLDTPDITMTADPGSYGLTGTAANLLHGWTMPAANGAYSLTGTQADLEFGRTVVATPGSYTLTGTATGFSQTHIMPAVVGSYTLNGTAVVFPQNTSMVAAPGTYALTGAATGFRYWQTSIVPGIYFLTGWSVDFSTGTLADMVPDNDPLIVFRHNEPEVVRVPKLNAVARQAAIKRVGVVSMAQLATIGPAMGLQVHVWNAPGGYAPAYADGFNWRKVSDDTVLI